MIDGRKKGKTIEESVALAFKPVPEPETPADTAGEGGVEEPGDPSHGQTPEGCRPVDWTVLLQGRQGCLPGAKQTLATMMASLGSGDQT